MRLWKVKTWADITIESNWFGRKRRYGCYFTYKSKYIYAETKEDARMKYGDLFFTPVEDGYDKESLRWAEYYAETFSNNMEFRLPFNYKIVHTKEYPMVVEKEVNANISTVMHHSTADDFRDWFLNNDVERYSLDELAWMDK